MLSLKKKKYISKPISNPTTRPTLKQVARAAGVSLATASNVVNKKYSLMSLETRNRVENVVQEMNYRVNGFGRGLRAAKGMNVAFISLDDDVAFLRDPFTAELVSGFVNSISANGYNTILKQINPDHLDSDIIFRKDDVVGIGMNLQGAQKSRKKSFKKFSTLHLPIVTLTEGSVLGVDVCSLRQNDFGGAVKLAKHVLERGAKSVLLVRQEVDWPGIDDRDRGIASIFSPLGPVPALRRITVDHMNLMSDVDGKLEMHIAKFGVPDAVMAANDHIAAVCMQTLDRHRIRVPDDVIVTGFNGFSIFDILPKKITTVRSIPYDLGFRGGQELIHRLQTGSFIETEIILPLEISIGNTS